MQDTYDQYMATASVSSRVFQAARSGDIRAVGEHLATSGDPNLKSPQGYSLLMLAAYNNQLHVSRLLLEAGADPDTSDKRGNTVLMGTAFKGLSTVGRLLLESGARVDARNPQGQTALIYAALFGRTEFMELLLEFGANPDLRDQSNNSARSIADANMPGRIFRMIKIFGKQILGN